MRKQKDTYIHWLLRNSQAHVGSEIGRTNLVAEIVTTQNHVFSYTITIGAEVLSRHFSSSHVPMSDSNTLNVYEFNVYNVCNMNCFVFTRDHIRLYISSAQAEVLLRLDKKFQFYQSSNIEV